MPSRVRRLGLAAILSLGAACGASAGERPYFGGHHGAADPAAIGYGGGYRFADQAVGGDYIGAPLTRFPRPREVVPSAWGYGTFGVPTVAGIRDAPSAAPTLTIINGVGRTPVRRGSGPRIVSKPAGESWTDVPAGPDAPRVVTVPRP